MAPINTLNVGLTSSTIVISAALIVKYPTPTVSTRVGAGVVELMGEGACAALCWNTGFTLGIGGYPNPLYPGYWIERLLRPMLEHTMEKYKK